MLRTPSIYATATPIMRPMLRVILTAIAFGAAGLVAGILVPIVRDPTTAQGPLLGVLITGPLGFVIGGHIGVLWSAHRRKQTTTAEIAWLLAFALLILLFYEFFAVIGAALLHGSRRRSRCYSWRSPLDCCARMHDPLGCDHTYSVS